MFNAITSPKRKDYAVMEASTRTSRTRNGVDHIDREHMADKLGRVLADSFAISLKTQNLHWNVVGPLFYSIHSLTEKQYQKMVPAIDALAERIRAIGFPAPASLKQFAEIAEVSDINSTEVSMEDFVSSLIFDHEQLASKLRDLVKDAEIRDDHKTADLLTEQIGFHEESAWMLRAIISK